METSPFPRALPPPEGSLVVIHIAQIAEAVQASRRSPRRRVILPFHKRNEDSLHRMLNAMQPGSYVQPHRHASPPKAESLVVLQGAIGYVAFDDDGAVDRHFVLQADGEQFGVDTEPGIFHTFFALEEDTVLFEVKPGPYEPTSDKDFAGWAPGEGEAQAAAYLAKLDALIRQVD